MLIAEIRRKLLDLEDIDANAPDALGQIRKLLSDSKEDILTADVFGVLKYLPRRPYLEAVINAIALHNSTAAEFLEHVGTLLDSLLDVQFRFWPTYPTPAGISEGGTEPDVELSSPATYLLVEAKLRSGFGKQQVERELAVAIAQSRGREPFLLLVTPASIPPRFSSNGKHLPFSDYLPEAISNNELPERAAALLRPHGRRVLWIGWYHILVAMKQAHIEHRRKGGETDAVARCGEMISDLEILLEQRDIRPFRGIPRSIAEYRTVTSNRPVLWNTGVATVAQTPFLPIPKITRFMPMPLAWKCPRSERPEMRHPFSIPNRCSSVSPEELTPCWRILRGTHDIQERLSIPKVVADRSNTRTRPVFLKRNQGAPL